MFIFLVKEHWDYFSLTPMQELRRSEFLITNWGYVGAKAPLLSTTPPFVVVTCESGGMQRHPMVICPHTVAIQGPQVRLTRGDQIWSSAPFPEMSTSSSRDFLVSQTTSVNPDPWVRWQADIPKWLSVQEQHLLILTHESGGNQTYPSDCPYKHNIC